MHVIDIADNLVRELEPFDGQSISIPSVLFWLRANVGMLNNYLKLKLFVNQQTLEINDKCGNLINHEEAAVYKSCYKIYYYERKERYYLGAAGFGEATQVSSDGGSVKLISKLDIAKQFTQLKKDEMNMLKNLINAYKRSHYCPQVVDSDDVDPLLRHYPSPYFVNQLGESV